MTKHEIFFLGLFLGAGLGVWIMCVVHIGKCQWGEIKARMARTRGGV
jgi:hypothetical protein